MRFLSGVAAFALAGLTNAQTTHGTLFLNYDGNWYYSYYETADLAQVGPGDDNYQVAMQTGNDWQIKYSNTAGTSYNWMPALRGGSVSFEADVSGLDCGCVQGAYLVNSSANRTECLDFPHDINDLQCKSISLFQADKYTWNSSVNPYGNVAVCGYDMAVEGVAKYGAGAYGPNGSKINTNFPFTVKTELVATANTANFWKLRTTLTQSGREIKLDADCRDDSYTMDYDLGGGVMDVAFSTWDNLSGADITFPLSDTCSAAASCSATTGKFADVTILTVGSNEDPPLPPPAEYQPWDVTIDGGLQTTYLKGIPDRPLTTSGNSATIGHNNRAFVLSVEDDSSVLNTLR